VIIKKIYWLKLAKVSNVQAPLSHANLKLNQLTFV